MKTCEIESLDQLDEALRRGPRSLRGARLQDLDLTTRESELLQHNDFHGCVVLGGRVSAALDDHLRTHGAIIFHDDPAVPVPVFRNRLYDYTDLYAGLTDDGYATTPDARAYAWSRDVRSARDAYATLQRAIHDDCVTDALHEWVIGRAIVGVMGGHAVRRGSPGFTEAALLGAHLAAAGRTVATGGGPGAMEAANLGATVGDPNTLPAVLEALAAVPDFRPSIDQWARAGWTVREQLGVGTGRSLGIPTWFYGHEPPNLFGSAIAKYFSNALREDILLAVCKAGIVVLPGAAGTVQEIFQVVTRLYYGAEPGPPLVLVGRDQWTRTVPVWPALQALGENSPLGPSLHLVDSVTEAQQIVLAADGGQAVEAAN